MSGSDSSGHGKDYFAPFLNALSRGTPASPGTARVTGTVGTSTVGVPSASATGDGTAQDTVVRTLAEHGGTLPLDGLLVPPFTSVGSLIGVVKELQSFGLVRMEEGAVHLTDAGMAVAGRLVVTP